LFPLYVTSSTEGSGQTTVIVGLARLLSSKGKTIGYFKPVPASGAAFAPDSDAVILRNVLSLTEPVEVLAPISRTDAEPDRNARQACARAAGNKDVVLIEGGRSPVSTATAFDARIVGVETHATDTTKATAFYKEAGDRLLGVIVNRVPRARLADATALSQTGLKILGYLPEDRALTSLTVADLATELGGKVVAGPAQSSTLIENVMLGAMTPDPGPLYFGQRANKAVVLKSERPDLQMAALQTSTACLVLAGKSAPIPAVLARATDTKVPVITVADNVPTVVNRLEMALGKARLNAAKVARAGELLSKRIDLASIYAALGVK
jgi:hypothetical protein